MRYRSKTRCIVRRTRPRRPATVHRIFVLAVLTLAGTSAASAPALAAAPINLSNYRVVDVCGPARPHAASCLAKKLIPASLTPACLLYTSDAADEEDSVDLG